MWGIDENQNRVLIIDESYIPYLYLVLDEKNTEEALENVRRTKDELPFVVGMEVIQRSLLGKPVEVIKVYCQDPDLVPKYASVLSKIKGVKEVLEDDIRYSMRYLIDNNVTPCGWHEIEAVEKENNSHFQVDRLFVAKTLPKAIDKAEIPPMRILSFSMMSHGSRGMPRPDKDPVVVISAVTEKGLRKQFISHDSDDRKIIESFVQHIKETDPDIIVGYGSGEHDWQYLLDRSEKLCLEIVVDRRHTRPHRSVYAHISITGRAHVDILDLADELPEVRLKTVENIADFLGVKRLGERLLIDEVDFAKYWEDPLRRPELARFSMENTESIHAIFEKLFDFVMQLSQLVALPLDQIGKAAVGYRTEWYLIREAYKIGELVPGRIERPYVPYAGSIVLNPKPGIHENITALDFKSMYPNIMIEQNISPDTYIPSSDPDPPSGVNVSPEAAYRFRKDPPGFYKKVISSLIASREEIRRKTKEFSGGTVEYHLLDARQRAIKVMTNALYGYAGWVGARWFMKPVAEATTAWGRYFISTALKMAENLGLNVIYGDTDSIFVTTDPVKIDELSRLTRREFKLEISPDKVYTRILFTEAKKRYCGLLPDGKLDMVGLEVVRGDWANVAKEIQERVLQLILRGDSPSRAADSVRKFITDIRARRLPYRDLIIWKTLTKSIDAYEVNAPHVAAAKILEKEGWSLTVGDKVGYVVITGSGRIYNRVRPYALASYDDVDIEYYVANQVIPAAIRILSMFNVKEEDLVPAKSQTLSDFFSKQ